MRAKESAPRTLPCRNAAGGEGNMKKLPLLFLFLGCFALGSLRAQTPADKPVVKLDPSLDALISPDAKLELVKNDFGFTEGIVWVDQGNGGYLLLSDMYA